MFLLTMQRYDIFTVCANNLIKNCCFVFALLICINRKCRNLPENTYCVLLRERTIYARVHNFLFVLYLHDVEVRICCSI